MAAKFSLQFCSFHGVRAIVPVGFIEFLQLGANARLALTNSGGMKEEASNGLPIRKRPIALDSSLLHTKHRLLRSC